VLTKAVDGADGSVTVEPSEPGRVSVCVKAVDLKALPGVLARVRRVFDLSADPDAIGRDLSADPVLAQLVADRPGLRPARELGSTTAPSRRTTRLTDETLAARAESWAAVASLRRPAPGHGRDHGRGPDGDDRCATRRLKP
jgi:AraC family transcriptional regulator of adaptative response / DNA-3-methyladenine glycosylase II